jgi:hypothetical protein
MAKRGGVASKLRGMKGAWGKAREETKNDKGFGEFVPVEPGMYVMQLVGVEIGDFGNARKLRAMYAVISDDESHGAICNDFMAIDDEERLVWLQRWLVRLGVDLDEFEPDDEDDLAELVRELIADGTCCKVKVVEKDGYTNMPVQRMVEVDEADLHDPEEALESAGVGEERPARGRGRGTSRRRQDGDDDAGAEPEAQEGAALDVGAKVTVEYDGEPWEGEVVEVMADTDEVKVHFEGDDSDEIVPVELAKPVDEEPETADQNDEVEKGDRVIVKVRGRQKTGTVQSVSKAKGTCKVKLDGTGSVVEVKQDAIDFEVDG